MRERLSEEQLNKLKEELLEKKKDLERARELLDQEDTFSNTDRTRGNAEFVDEAEEDRSHYETELEERNVNKTLELVDKALGKIEAETYGICEECGKPINVGRLMANPEAETCKDDAK